MRGKRSKTYRKLMLQYQLNFSFRTPYQVLLDSAIIQAASSTKMALGDRLSTTLHGEIKPMITQCCIRHLYNAAPCPEKDAWIAVAKAAERRRCGHHELEEPLSEEECIMSVVDPKGSGGNRNRYVVATQDEGLRRRLRGVVGVPLVYVRRSVMILEPMARVTEQVREQEAKEKVKAGLVGRRGVLAGVGEKRKREDGDSEDGAQGPREEGEKKKKRKVKGPKGPNPLSAKKAKPKPVLDMERAAVVKKAAKKDDPQAAEKAGLIPPQSEDGEAQQASTKRKRKRKPKDAQVHVADGGEVADGEEDA
ncbi:related to rRNA-processing protein utp23 [Ramularia collo-cygni]|uniref:U three protein 23 n=1 Tax=Ramularia collo-cygni TaxID=112498 RepID=A0A2D3V5D5_9PEZI|nr:related to rRNA-processing protein utp23 [Ramularia collo-cygni]CZT17724.1 related to rRNA-processing protein utp23 [Ramularia collo-cygni]